MEADLNQRSLQLSREFLTSHDPRKKAEIRAELRRVLDQLFDLNVQNQSEELDYLESQIQIRKEELKIKQSEKARLVARNLSELTELK
jgi:nicotinic acid phosphoribosyltransferase